MRGLWDGRVGDGWLMDTICEIDKIRDKNHNKNQNQVGWWYEEL